MARFQPPGTFDFADPTQWDDWLERFRQFRKVTKLHKEDEDVQVATLLYTMGPQATTVFKQLTFADAGDREKYKEVETKLSAYFKPVSNVVHERTMFERATQSPSETVDEFLRRLHRIADKCEFKDARDDRIRDRFMANLVDRKLTLELQLLDKPDLAKAATHARNYEQVHRQVAAQRHQLEISAPPQAAAVRSSAPSQRRPDHSPALRTGQEPCRWCGKPATHSRRECPARSEKCSSCGKMGHYSRVCLSKASKAPQQQSAHSVQPASWSPPDQSQSLFMGGVTDANLLEGGPWMRSVTIGQTPVVFKVDTGADTSVMNASTFASLQPAPALKRPSTNLMGPDGARLNLAGQFSVASQALTGEVFNHEVYVLAGDGANLLSRQASIRMGFVRQGIGHIKADPTRAEPLGCMQGPPATIRLKPDAQPYHCPVARRVPFPLLQKVEAELARMVDTGIVEPVTEPTEWCAPMVAVRKKSGDVRICVDLKRLNASVQRESFVLPTVDETLAKLAGATVFSTLDTRKGFWQVPLAASSQHLATFITPFGRYMFRRLPFGITSAPEIFQRRLMAILEGIQGVCVFMDDILVYGATIEAHDLALQQVREALAAASVTLNPDKSHLRQPTVKFLGHRISASGVQPDPDRVAAILQLAAPTDVPGLRRLLGLFNYVGKFIPDLASISAPLRALLRTDVAWLWDAQQQAALDQLKSLVAKACTLAFFDPAKPATVSADASSYGLGATLLQMHDGELRPVAYASKSLSDTEKRYAQIEKELLAVTWACDHFAQYLQGGCPFQVQTDHKPLVPLINARDLDNTPLRCQRMLMRLLRYDVTAVYVPGPRLVVADALSRAPGDDSTETSTMADVINDIEAHVSAVSAEYASPDFCSRVRLAIADEAILAQVRQFVAAGWPDKEHSIPDNLHPYFHSRQALSIADGCLYFGDRLVIPASLQSEVLRAIHEGHQGVTKCRARARAAVWWPGLSSQIADTVRNCEVCSRTRLVPAAPLHPLPLPDRPWQRVAADLFTLDGIDYLITVDYFSRFVEVDQLRTTTSAAIIAALNMHFARHGFPDSFVSDNGPQFASSEFALFLTRHDIEHRTSSPRYPQSNGMVERSVRTIKELLRKSTDLPTALLAYRSTPLQCGFTPAQLLMGRQLRSTVPTPAAQLTPAWPDLDLVRRREAQQQDRQASDFDRRHRVRSPSRLAAGDRVWVTDLRQEGVVQLQLSERSYNVKTATSTVRRNARSLRPLPPSPAEVETPAAPIALQPEATGTRGRESPVASCDGTPAAAEAGTSATSTTRSGRKAIAPERLISTI
ncbi:uncharacterized protein K02A2.6-like [Sycon ciliatum]|uniref:uncharacterized protein K02A2.6-like n=1 Tax=Sycon ciliatum TaxID=27933 RepID=UPI0031F65016